MTDEEVKRLWENTAVSFYQERKDDGIAVMEDVIREALAFPELGPTIESLLGALENGDYTLAADILHFEMAERL